MDGMLYKRSLECPICEHKYKSSKPKYDSIRIIKTDTDFCNYYKYTNPYFYEINVCPKCGFAYSDKFNKYMDNKDKLKFINNISSRWIKKDYTGPRDINDALEAYKLALLSYEFINMKYLALAGVCLHIAWLYRLNLNCEKEIKYIQKAIVLFQKSYEEEDNLHNTEGIDTPTLVYILGELNFRIENYKDCIRWFNIGISKYTGAYTTNIRMAKIIKERWYDIKEQITKNKEQRIENRE